MSVSKLVSCDTFVAMSDVTLEKAVIFGKNSDRPQGEVQEVVHVPSAKHSPEATLQCTYITIPQVAHTHAMLLSKPAWMWGAEMGVNEHGVAIGNEAVWNRLSEDSHDLVERLLGMDLLRLALERSTSAEQAVDVLTDLLDKFGQGGPCSDIVADFSYHNAFLVADAKEAWILETANKFWVAEKVNSGVRNISNCMSIRTEFAKMHPNLKAHAKANQWWDGSEAFDWKKVIGGFASSELEEPNERLDCGKRLLDDLSRDQTFKVEDMRTVLRDAPSGICRPSYSAFPTTGAQISLIMVDPDQSCHWFTATQDPRRSIFKLCPGFKWMEQNAVGCDSGLTLSPGTKSPSSFPVVVKRPKDREHDLWQFHKSCPVRKTASTALNHLEDMNEERSNRDQCNIFDFWVQKEISALRRVKKNPMWLRRV